MRKICKAVLLCTALLIATPLALAQQPTSTGRPTSPTATAPTSPAPVTPTPPTIVDTGRAADTAVPTTKATETKPGGVVQTGPDYSLFWALCLILCPIAIAFIYYSFVRKKE